MLCREGGLRRRFGVSGAGEGLRARTCECVRKCADCKKRNERSPHGDAKAHARPQKSVRPFSRDRSYGAQSRSDAGQKRAGYGRSAPAALPKKPKKTFAAPPLPADTADKFFCTRRAKNDFRDVGATRGPRPRRGGVPRRERPERHPQRAEVGGEEEEPHAEQDGESPDSDPIISSRSSSSPRRRPPPDRPR